MNQNKALKKKELNNNKQYLFLYLCLLSISLYTYSIILIQDINPDIWWMLTIGKNILSDGFSTVDSLTMHENMHCIAQQWLTDVIYYKIYDILGFIGLNIIIVLLGLIEFSLVFCITKKITKSPGKTAFISCLSLFYAIFISPRPHMISVILLTLTLYVYESYFRGKNILYLLPIISLVLINVHAAFWPVMFIFALPYLFEAFCGKYIVQFFDKKEKFKKYIKTFQYTSASKLKLVIYTLSVFPVALVNPFGIEAVLYGFKSTNNETISKITQEMRSLFAINIDFQNFSVREMFAELIVPVFVLLVIVGVAISKNKKISIRNVCLLIGLFFMSCISYKYVLLFIIGLPYFARESVSENITLFKNENNFQKKIIVALCFAIFMTAFTGLTFYAQDFKILGQEEIDYIIKTDDRNDIKILCFNEGGYAEFNGLKSYMDTRMEVFIEKNNKKEDLLAEAQQVLFSDADKKAYKDFFNKYDFDYILADQGWRPGIIEHIESSGEWEKISESEDTGVKCTLYKNIIN